MLNKLLSLRYKVVNRGTLVSEVIENTYGRARYEYIVNKLLLCIPVGVNGRNSRDFHIYGPNRKGEDRREMYASLPARDEGTDGEKGVDIDLALKRCVRYEWYFILQVMFKMAIIRYLLSRCGKMAYSLREKGCENYVVNLTLHVLYKRVVCSEIACN
ncbi:hypothetical protein Cfor_00269 [Coptotermes formosanus]|jgi:hypothetical protein|uniref:Uncharacterized protein n=1 Tax=Coptotermes formosanus TaxID=36987 RepID=A0A6L2P9U6_COPFO|nr:hypothetical protein Cfor_00269 [Coptotermes formosanus]